MQPFNNQNNISKLGQIKRLYSLDVLRGFASLTVVLAHWKFFYIPSGTQMSLMNTDPYLLNLLMWFDQFGGKAVELFFCISGFVFFWLYSNRISQSKVLFRQFAALRFSRLYPLHLITLLAVALGQIYYFQLTNNHFAIENNNLAHFVLNLFFASSWGIEKGLSFNGPIWSVSIEVLLYILYFIFCRFFSSKFILLFTVAIISHFMVTKFNYYVGKGLELFFLGGCAYLILLKIIATDSLAKNRAWLSLFTIISWLGLLFFTFDFGSTILSSQPALIQKILSHMTTFIIFPATILSLALHELNHGPLGKRLSLIGDISYSTYLLHFPLQLAIVIVWSKFDINHNWLYSLRFMLLFFTVLIFASTLSYHYFELPAQKWLRNKLISSNEK